ncbi:MAG: DUF2752 domain-containing protein [Muribaculaceae bacterium]|nr:DUF2752 domain-containing protein [Muribaculaceae bacterium]
MFNLDRRQILILICLLIAGIFIILFYYFFNPAESNFMPRCIFHELTGYKCMGCGVQRALYHTLHGNFYEAVKMNFGLLVSIPVIFLYLFSEYNRVRFSRLFFALHSMPAIIALIILVVAWTVIRNIVGL